MVRAKFRCESKTQYANGQTLKFLPVTCGSAENEKFFKWTPSGLIEIGTINNEAAEQFIPGKEYYVDFAECAE